MAIAEEEIYRREHEPLPSGELTSPSLLLLNSRMFLYELGEKMGKPVTVKDIGEEVLDEWAEKHEMIWFMGMYKPSPKSVELARTHIKEYRDYALPDVTPEDIIGSPFAIYDYSPDPHIAHSWQEWDAFKRRLTDRGLTVWGDFIPNHVGIDHPWAKLYPEMFISVDEATYQKTPRDYVVVTVKDKTYYYAKGKDPNYPDMPWEDTLQFNYASLKTQQMMADILLSLMDHFDGVRCDMAMLINANKFYQTWGWYLNERGFVWPGDFWEKIVKLAKAKAKVLGRKFLFMAETYDDDNNGNNALLGEYGFDYEYQKHFYDELRWVAKNENDIHPGNITETLRHFLRSETTRPQIWVNFVANHDEPRAVAEFGKAQSLAAATIEAFIAHSVFMVQDDDDKGYTTKANIHLRRRRKEVVDTEIFAYYQRLFSERKNPLFQQGRRTIPHVIPLNDHDISFANIVPQQGQLGNEDAVVCTNYSPHNSEGFLSIPPDAQDLYVYDLNTREILSGDDIAKVNTDGTWYIQLEPWHSQIVYWKTSDSGM